MINEADESPAHRPAAAAFWWRLTDNAFRRAGWLLLPVLLLSVLGYVQANRTLELYESTGVLTASSNPLVPDQQLGGINAQYWESPAEAASRTITEQLRTDSFIEAVAERAGLTDAVMSGAITVEVVRSSIWSSADGTSLVKVNASWADPQTTFALVDGTIGAYQQFVGEQVASDSSEAEVFYTEQLTQYEAEVVIAQQDLVEFVDSLPETSAEPTLAVSLQLERLSEAVKAAEAKVTATEDDIEAARLAAAQAKSEAGRSLTVIDAPKVPTAPESTLVSRATTVISFLLLGVVIAIGALLLGTVLDQSVASSSDLLAIEGVGLVTSVPPLRFVTPAEQRALAERKRSPRKERRERRTAREPETVDA